ncbi:MAG: hypothetical protein HYU84_04625 [Chloroflexi bacterium]|nr:hypothetical protein [Chloroflexota bacterium]
MSHMNIKNLFSFTTSKNGKATTLLFLLGAILSLLWSFYFAQATITTPYQIGFREGAPQVLTSMLIHGENPYIFENQPLAFNNYSIAYSVAVLPFALMFGNTLHIHRWVTFIFILLSTSLGFWVVFKRGRNLSTALICCAFIIIGFLGRGGVGSAPTTMGTFLFLAAVFIPYLRSFDNASMVISAILALLALHTKAYFVLSFGIVATYVFLLISKKKAIYYFLLFFALFVISFVAIRLNYPLYFIDVLRGNVSNTFRTLEHLASQLMWLSIYFGPILALTVIALWKDKSSLKVANLRLNVSAWDKPFLEMPFDFYLYAFIICILTFVFVLGSHVGNYLSYAYELVVPTFLFWFFVSIDQKKAFTGLSAAIILINLFYWQNETIGPSLLGDKNSVEWEKLFSYLKPTMNVLNSPTITSRLIELGIKPVDSGQTDYYYTMKPYPDNFLFGPSYEEFYNDGQEYTQSINESIAAQRYDLIVTSKDVDVFYDLDLIAEHYEMTDQLILYIPQTEQKWVVEVWEPIQK